MLAPFIIFLAIPAIVIFCIAFRINRLFAIFSIFGFLYQASVIYYSVINSSSSTAGIGLIGIPILGGAVAIIFGIAGGFLSKFFRLQKTEKKHSWIYLAASILILGFFAQLELRELHLLYKVKQIRNMTSIQLENLMRAPPMNRWRLAAVTQNKHVTSEMLHAITLIDNAELSQDVYESQYSGIKGGNRKGMPVIALIGLHPKTGLKTLVEVINLKDPKLIAPLIKSPKISTELLRKIYTDHKGNKDIEWQLAKNTKTPIDILKELANSKDFFILSSVARNPKTPENLLRQLYAEHKGDALLMGTLAHNINVPIDILKNLSKSKDSYVASYAIRNPKLPTNMLREIYSNRNNENKAKIEIALASKPDVPIDILKKLANSKDVLVLSSVAGNPKTPENLLRKIYTAYKSTAIIERGLAGNTNTPTGVLTELADSKGKLVLSFVARNPKTPEDLLRKIYAAHKGDIRIEKGLKSNANLPTDILKEIEKTEKN